MEKAQKTAIVIGATGLIGHNLVKLLLKDNAYSKINIFVRRTTGIQHPKLNEHIVDFEHFEQWRDKIQGDVLFSAMGTTLKDAGSKEAQYKVDYTYQYNVAVTAATNGVKDYVLVSAIKANSNSSFFYVRIKGELEDAATKLPFRTIVIVRPGILYGKRENFRLRENIVIKLVNSMNKIGLMKKSRPIHGKEVAQAMLYGYSIAKGLEYYSGNKLFYLAAKYDM